MAVVSPEAIAARVDSFQNMLGTAKRVTLKDKDSEDKSISEAIRISVTQTPQSPWSIGFQIMTERTVEKNEVLLLRFKARCVDDNTETGGAVLRALFEKGSAPYSKSLSKDVEVGKEWVEFSFPFKSVDSYKPGEAKIGFQFGFQMQSFEITDFALDSFGKDCDIKKLPQSKMTYVGRGANASWRKEAEKRIDEIRKGAIAIHVCDGEGNPVENATVELKMLRHAFPWGTAVTTKLLLQQDEDGDRYREIVEKYFNRVAFENDMKWYAWDNDKKRIETLKAIDWLRERKIEVRGHCLLWPSWRNSPTEYKALADEPEKLRQVVLKRMERIAVSLRGLVVDWDVINEPLDNNDLMKIMGDDEMARWFRFVRQLDTNAKLYVNDYSILAAQGLDKAHQNHLENTIRLIQSQGAPITGVGLQSHFVESATPPERVKKNLDRFAALGLSIAITEHDIDTEDEQLQADYTRDFLTIVFSHPAVDSVLCWGFWENSHWRPNGAYFRADWSLKPAGQAWIDRTMKEWWTNEKGATDAQGTFQARGFLGDYDITVRHGECVRTIFSPIPKSGIDVKITLP